MKSAYLAMQNGNEQNTLAPNSDFWRKLWNLKIPNKVKHFVWQAASNFLPTKDMFLVKRVQVNALCAVCNSHPETVLHTLVSFPFAAACFKKA